MPAGTIAVSLPGALYGAAARARRRWYANHPGARRRLARPVISVGNLTVGGSGKTPAVACVARLLLAMGERPAILSRGYARRVASGGVTIVSDGRQVTADLDHAGDEPLMLARSVPGAAVVVAAKRYEAGRVAEDQLACTVHLLDDGFQHFALERDVNLLMLAPRDLDDTLLPGGRLREQAAAAAAADAVIVGDATPEEAEATARRAGVAHAFRAVTVVGPPRALDPYGAPADLPAQAAVLAVTGIARPERFFDTVRRQGLTLAGEIPFPDHHVFSSRDVKWMVDTARQCGASAVVTTEKDAVRLQPRLPIGVPVVWLPLELTIEPADAFRDWLRGRLAQARAAYAGRKAASS